MPTTRWLGSYPGTLLQGHCITIIWCTLLVRVLSQYGFFVPLHELSSLGTLLVRVLSQYPVKVRSPCVPLGSWGSAQVYCITIIWSLPGFGVQLGGHHHYLAVAQLPYAGRGFLPLPGSWGHISVCCRTVIAYHYFAAAETQGHS